MINNPYQQSAAPTSWYRLGLMLLASLVLILLWNFQIHSNKHSTPRATPVHHYHKSNHDKSASKSKSSKKSPSSSVGKLDIVSNMCQAKHVLARSTLKPLRHSDKTGRVQKPSMPFPLPKLFHEDSSANKQRLLLATDYQIHASYDQQIRTTGKARLEELITLSSQRFCHRHIEHYQVSTDSLVLHEIHIHVTKEHSIAIYVNQTYHEINHYYKQEEAYIINIEPSGVVNIIVNAGHGVIYALTTLSQMLTSSSSYQLPLQLIDWAEKDWRGVSLDVSRHFIPIPLLKRTIDGMEVSKFNVLHLHLTDAQSFPILLQDTLPYFNMTTLGIAGHHNSSNEVDLSKLYSIQDLQGLVQYANERGIDVVPEIDVPAHALSWGYALADLVVPCHSAAKTASSQFSSQQNVYPLDPSHPWTFPIIEEVLRQIAMIFPSPYFHVGGDEVHEHCWTESPKVVTWAKENNVSIHHITKYFEEQVFRMMKKFHKIPLVWQGIIDGNNMPTTLPQEPDTSTSSGNGAGNKNSRMLVSRALTNTDQSDQNYLYFTANTSSALHDDTTKTIRSQAIVEPWKCWSGLAVRASITSYRTNHPVIMAACWYLDYNSDWTTFLALDFYEEAYDQLQDLVKSDNKQKQNKTLSTVEANEEVEKTMIGGEGAIWTENIDSSNYECRIWPRIGGVAQRLWGIGLNFCHLMNAGNNEGSTESVFDLLPCRKYKSLLLSPDLANANNSNAKQSTYFHRNEEIALSVLATKILYASYIEYHQFLAHYQRIRIAELVYHYPDMQSINAPRRKNSASSTDRSSSSRGSNGGGMMGSQQPLPMIPYSPQSFADAILKVEELQIGIVISHRGIHPRVQLLNSNNFNSTSSSSNKEHAIFWITAQCLGMDPTIQRPLTSTHLSIAQYNIQDGAFPLTSSSGSTSSSNKNMVNGRVNRGDKLIEWLTMQANAGTMFIGICELSHWEHLANKADVVKNLPILVTRAASVGYSHSHMTPLPYYEHPPQLRTANPIASSAAYPVGFLSVLPFTVVKEIIAPTFQRNALHIYIAEVDLHVWIVHLHAHSVIQRVAEVQVLLKENAMLLKQKAKIVIMGDFNTLSPHDRLQHDDDKIVSMIQDRPTDSVMTRWKKKYLNAAGDKIDYSPMELLLMAGFVDSCVQSCCDRIQQNNQSDYCNNQQSTKEEEILSWSIKLNDPLSQCMTKYCAFTEPTLHNPEWPMDSLQIPHPKIRLDFMLLSPGLIHSMSSSDAPTSSLQLELFGGVDRNNLTDIISDHYPVMASWKHPQSIPYYRHRRL